MSLKLTQLAARSFPRDHRSLARPDLVVQHNVIGSFAPSTPPLAASDSIACIGSCFAQELSKSLAAKGRNVLPIFISERWNTAFALRRFLELAMEGTPIPGGFIPSGVDAAEIMASAGDIRRADAFILTFGLSVCWFEKATSQMVLDVPQGASIKGATVAFETHEMRQTSFDENLEQITSAVACIRRHKPTAPIILTLSPIPLLISLTSYPAISSNNISKAVLRAALHCVWERRMEHVTYWPSYDIVEFMAKYHGPIFGQGEDDLRHIKQPLINDIMELFDAYYFKGDGP
jgi:hypothetical protein